MLFPLSVLFIIGNNIHDNKSLYNLILFCSYLLTLVSTYKI